MTTANAPEHRLAPPAEPRIHSHVTDRLPGDHPLADERVYCDRCETLLHMQTNSCMRTWIESGCGNYCMRCFIVVARGFAAVRRAWAASTVSRSASGST